MHTRERGCCHPPLVRRSTVKRRLCHLNGSVFLGLCLPLANHLVSFSTPDLPWVLTHSSSQGGSQSEGFRQEQDSPWPGIIPCLLTLGELFCTCLVSPMSPKGGEGRFLNPLLKQGFTSLCPRRHHYLDYLDYESYLKVFTRDKHQLFTLFLLLLPFWRANRRLIVNALTGAHLSHVSGNANSGLVVGIQPEAHFFP